MKFALIVLGLGLSWTAFAGEENFEEHKKKVLENTDKKITAMQEHKSCIGAAKDHPAMKACFEKMKDFRMDMKEDHMKARHDRLGEKIKDMEKKKTP